MLPDWFRLLKDFTLKVQCISTEVLHAVEAVVAPLTDRRERLVLQVQPQGPLQRLPPQ